MRQTTLKYIEKTGTAVLDQHERPLLASLVDQHRSSLAVSVLLGGPLMGAVNLGASIAADLRAHRSGQSPSRVTSAVALRHRAALVLTDRRVALVSNGVRPSKANLIAEWPIDEIAMTKNDDLLVIWFADGTHLPLSHHDGAKFKEWQALFEGHQIRSDLVLQHLIIT